MDNFVMRKPNVSLTKEKKRYGTCPGLTDGRKRKTDVF